MKKTILLLGLLLSSATTTFAKSKGVLTDPLITPTFSVGWLCANDANDAVQYLPTTSNNGISGSWQLDHWCLYCDGINDLMVKTDLTCWYIFVPAPDQSAASTTIMVTVTPRITADFDYSFIGENLQLPRSKNGISGTWSPATLQEGKHNYTFTATTPCSAGVSIDFVYIKDHSKDISATNDEYNVVPDRNKVYLKTASVLKNDFLADGTGASNTNIDLALFSRDIDQDYIDSGGPLPVLNPDGTIDVPMAMLDSHAYPFSITYKIMSKECASNFATATATITMGTGTARMASKNPEFAETIPFYPNPSSGIFNIDLTRIKEDYDNIKVYNLLGVEIFAGPLTLKSLNQIDLSNAAKGYYMAKISNGENSTAIKLLKE